MATENNHPPHPGSISVELAAEFTSNWRTYLAASNNEFDLKSFWISIEHIKSLLAHNPDADGMRVYLGLSDPENPTSFKFVTVTTKHQEDVIELPDGAPNLIPPPVYCPPVCPTGGVLNG